MQLIEKRVVQITAKNQDNGDAIWQFKVHITGTNFHKTTTKLNLLAIQYIKNGIYKLKNL